MSSWNATLPLRIRVSMSAMGSVIVMTAPSPAGLRHARHFAGVHHLAKADAAQPELAVHRLRSTAAPAACVGAHLELGLAQLLLDKSLLCHALLLSFASEREAEGVEQRSTLGVRTGGGDDRDVHAPGSVDLVVVGLREDELLGDAERVVATPVEAVGRQAAEVADPGNRQGDDAVEELPHAVA